MTYDGSTYDTNVFTVETNCVALTTSTPSATAQTVPTSATGSHTQVIARTSYVTTTSSHASCTLANFVLHLNSDQVNAYSGSLASIDASGNVKVNKDIKVSETFVVKYDYQSNKAKQTTASFTLTVNCAALGAIT